MTILAQVRKSHINLMVKMLDIINHLLHDVSQADPQLPAYQHDAIAIEDAYNGQDLATVLTELRTSRGQTIDIF